MSAITMDGMAQSRIRNIQKRLFLRLLTMRFVFEHNEKVHKTYNELLLNALNSIYCTWLKLFQKSGKSNNFRINYVNNFVLKPKLIFKKDDKKSRGESKCNSISIGLCRTNDFFDFTFIFCQPKLYEIYHFLVKLSCV